MSHLKLSRGRRKKNKCIKTFQEDRIIITFLMEDEERVSHEDNQRGMHTHFSNHKYLAVIEKFF
jgi:hypothetical protein